MEISIENQITFYRQMIDELNDAMLNSTNLDDYRKFLIAKQKIQNKIKTLLQ